MTGFTLIELLIAVAIIALLGSGVLFTINDVQRKGRDAKRVSDINALRDALHHYAFEKGHYPPPGNVGVSGWGCGITYSPWSNCDILKGYLKPYLSHIPYDPQDQRITTPNTGCQIKPCYVFLTPTPEHDTYCLCARLEKPDNVIIPNYCINTWSKANYCISSEP